MTRLLITVALLASAAAFALAPAHAGDDNASMPKSLVIGYEEEGKVDASQDACSVFVKEVVEWEKAEMEQAVRDVCAVRQKHLDAYAAFQAAYGKFRSTMQEQTRFDGTQAAKSLAGLVKSCVEMKWALSTGGHNIGIDMVPNTIDAECLDVGRDILVKETDRLNIDEPQPKAGK
ncbi:MAG: hypothetical protein AB7S70_14760 [Hyphomicrobium sp.]|uniref:hypothetical protein n=1 Tax=Hyphomicrobium sp. TaxID=82 RepID=UPI003D09E365